MNILKPLIATCTLFIAVGSIAIGQERIDQRLPLKVTSWDEISKHLNESEIVVVGMADSFDGQDQDDTSRDLSPPSKKLSYYLRKLRELGGEAIPGLAEKVPFSDKISILVVESGKEGEAAAGEAHKQKARFLYEMLGAQPYVLSNPVIFLIHKGKLVRSYGAYHEPGSDGIKLQQLAATLLSPATSNKPALPEIVMMKTLGLRKEKGDKEAIAYLTDQFLQFFGTPGFFNAYSYFWTEAQVRSGAEDALWSSMIFDALFTTCQRPGYYDRSMQVVSNLCSNLTACGRFGRLAEVMAVWENGQKMAGNRMNISSYQDMGPAISCLPEIRHRNMPITQPSEKTIPAGSNANGFHVNQAGAFRDYASLHYASGRWQESLEYTIWVRDWATDKKTTQPIGEFATSWYGATSTLISSLKYMGFQDEALALVEEGLAAPHGKTYHGRWKIFLAADHLHSLMQLDRTPSDIIEQYTALIEKAKPNGHISKSGVWGIQDQLAEALIKVGRTQEGEALYDQLVSEGSLTARRSRLTYWIKSGRVNGVEDELKDLLRFSRETGQKMSEYSLYRDYADFLEKTGRQREALLMRREVIRLAKIFGLFTHLPVEQSKLAVLLMQLGDPSGSDEQAEIVRDQINRGRLPKSIIAEINANLAKLENLLANSIAKQQENLSVDLQPHKSIVIPIAELPWTTYLTLMNPSKLVKAGHLKIEGQSVECSADEETENITITLLDTTVDPAPKEFACSLKPGTYRLIQMNARAEAKIEGEIRISWQDAESSSSASVMLEAPESGVSGSIIQAGNYRANPFYGVPMFLQYVTNEAVTNSPPLRFVCSHSSRVEIYQLDGTPLAIDAQGNGSLLNQGDELFVKSDGAGNLILPLTKGNAAMNLLLYPDKGIPNEGLTIDIEAFVDNAWQLYSRNQLAK